MMKEEKKTLSTGITYPLRTTQKKKAQAMKAAEKAGFLRILEYKEIQEELKRLRGMISYQSTWRKTTILTSVQTLLPRLESVTETP